MNVAKSRRPFTVENKFAAELLERVAHTEPIAGKVDQIAKRRISVRFSHVVQSAHAFLSGIVARKIQNTVWILCPSVRAQDSIFETLLNWIPSAQFLPEAEFAAVENVLPDPEIAAERLALLAKIDSEPGPHVIVTTRASLDQPAPKRGLVPAATLRIKRGSSAAMEPLLEKLADASYQRVSLVTTRGQFAVRGGIVDLYSWQAPLPVRIEFFDDNVESLREFDVDTQTSVRDLREIDILLGTPDDKGGVVRDYIGTDDLTIDLEPEENSNARTQISEGWIEEGPEDFSGAFQDCDVGEFAVGDFLLAEAKRDQFIKRLEEWREKQARIVVYFQTEGEIERFRELISSEALHHVDLVLGTLARGFCFAAANLVILSAAELFGRFAPHARRHLYHAERHRAQIDFSELNEDDLVVHLEHGVGRFLGLSKIRTSTNAEQEVLALEFADEAKLYLPLEQAYLVSRYVGVGKRSPQLSSLADSKWARAKKSATASILDYAGKMLAVQAERETVPGHAFGADTKWQLEFEHSFPFRETPDQMKAIIDAKIDMERPRPMDRLICGDVGFGKTEVAIRAAFKSVMDGRQVAVLAPTTVLAQQHFEVFRQRMLDYPVRIEMLSRFRSHSEQRKILELLRQGGVDIVIGTHRLISGDVVFKDLGLVIIDEEQRFGVLHKEMFKELFKLVDVL
ncbi:MAG: DEAD/DEAH box helicase, partial [Verrucomicrobia bacterium]|nr:DEAD/DEAH box helicase [Verrucomicrobiota bacterium]